MRTILLVLAALLPGTLAHAQLGTAGNLPPASTFGAAGDTMLCHTAAGVRLCTPGQIGGSLTAAGRSAEVRARDRINVLDAPYGAACDGTTDDTSALQAAFAAAAAVPGGAVLEIPQRRCLFSGAVSQALGAGQAIHLRGAGGVSGLVSTNGAGISITLTDRSAGFDASDLSLLRAGTGQSGVALAVQAAAGQALHPARFRDLVVGPLVEGGASWAECLRMTGLAVPKVDGLRCKMPDTSAAGGSGYGVRIIGLDTSRFAIDAKISNSVFQGGFAGIKAEGAVQGVFVANSEMLGGDYGVHASDPGGTMFAEGVSVVGGHTNTRLAGVFLDHFNESSVVGLFEMLRFLPAAGSEWSAVRANASSHLTITGNKALGTGALLESFFKATGGGQIMTVTGNNASNLAGYCIDVQAANAVVVTGNGCLGVTDPGIMLGTNSSAAANNVNGRLELAGAGSATASVGTMLARTGTITSLPSAANSQAAAIKVTAEYVYVGVVQSGGSLGLPPTQGLPQGRAMTIEMFNADASNDGRIWPGVNPDSSSDAIYVMGAQVYYPFAHQAGVRCTWPGGGNTWVCRAA